MWEFFGDVGLGLAQAEHCQFRECDGTRAAELEDAAIGTPYGQGYQATLSEWLDWEAFHRYQCLSWMLGLADDPVHALNNIVIAERMDGKFQYLPYSVDVSLDPSLDTVPLGGYSLIAAGCASDPECWSGTITTCGRMLPEFVAIDPIGMLEGIQQQLDGAGMLRAGDEDNYRELHDHLASRIAALPSELEQNRPAPVMPFCPAGLDACEGYCTLPGQCNLCGDAAATGASLDAGAATDGGIPNEPEACLRALDSF